MLSSMAVLYHVNGYLPRAYLRWLFSIIIVSIKCIISLVPKYAVFIHNCTLQTSLLQYFLVISIGNLKVKLLGKSVYHNLPVTHIYKNLLDLAWLN